MSAAHEQGEAQDPLQIKNLNQIHLCYRSIFIFYYQENQEVEQQLMKTWSMKDVVRSATDPWDLMQ